MKCGNCDKTKSVYDMARFGSSKPYRYVCKECYFQ